VVKAVCDAGPNEFLEAWPPTLVDFSEETLPRITLCVLTQIRSTKCIHLRTYLKRIGRTDDVTCPECHSFPHTAALLFACTAHVTDLVRMDCRKRPREVAKFLTTLPFFAHLPQVNPFPMRLKGRFKLYLCDTMATTTTTSKLQLGAISKQFEIGGSDGVHFHRIFYVVPDLINF
jgi:hypothetical protein